MLSRVRLFCDPMDCSTPASLSIIISRNLLKLCPLNQWCHPTISSSVIPFSSCLQSFPASGSFPMSQIFESGGQSIGVSASASVLPMHIQDWCPLVLTGLILQSKGLWRVFSNTTVQKHQFFSAQLSSTIQLSHPYMTTGFSSFDHEYEAMNRWLLNGTILHSYFPKNMDQNSHPIKTQIFGTKYFVSINSPTFS